MLSFDTAAALKECFKEYANSTNDWSVYNFHKMCKEIMENTNHYMHKEAMYMWNPQWRDEYIKENK